MPWDRNEPTDDKGECTQMNWRVVTELKTGKWGMYDCDRPLPFVCKYRSSDEPVEPVGDLDEKLKVSKKI